jgi:D-alanyl-D-alanine carboxypeptidase/D-alanyl-D-alanine carboxypeptidase (penicillin-binding protein 5/6)
VEAIKDPRVVVEYVDERRFVELMNRRASALGLANTHFVNSSGLNVAGHYSSARDLSLLGREAMKDGRFRALASRTWATVKWEPSREARVHSHNRFNELYDWVDGIKTGATEGTGACMVATGKYGGRRLIVTTLHEPNRDHEVRDALKLFKYGASLFARSTVVRFGEPLTVVPVEGGGWAQLTAAAGLARMVRKGAGISTRFDVPASLPASGRHDVVGSADFWADGVRLGSVPLRVTASSARSVAGSPPPAL